MTAAHLSADLRHGLADQLTADHALTDPQWRKAVEAVPREVFLGEAVFRRLTDAGPTRWEPLRRAEVSEQEWLELVYANATWVTQVDGVGAADTTEPVTGSPTSSSLPAVVVGMLQVTGLAEGESVLEIGTGTGYSAALMCRRLGNDATGSQATTEPNPAGGWTVRRHGPLSLWDAVEDAILTWQEAGSPHQSAFGLTVTRERQYVWLGDPGGPTWDLPA